jgi:hypothetical protein
MAKEGSDSDDEMIVLEVKLPGANRAVADFLQSRKKPKIEGGTSSSVVEESSSYRVCLAPWSALGDQIDYFYEAATVNQFVAAKLLEFVSSCLVQSEIQDQLVAAFVEQYQVAPRIGFVQGEKWELTAEVVGKTLKLPMEGVNFASLKEEEFPIGDCFLEPQMVVAACPEEGAAQRISKQVLKEQWRQLGNFVQQWLCLQVDSDAVNRGALVAAVAVFRFRKVINWAKYLARRLHHSLQQVKINPLDSHRSFLGGYYLSKLLVSATTRIDRVIKPESTPTTSQLGELTSPALQPPDHYRRLATEARQFELLAAQPNIFEDFSRLQAQHQQLQLEMEQLKQRMTRIGAQSQTQLETEQTMRVGQTEVAALLDQLEAARVQLVEYEKEQVKQKERYVEVNTQLMRLKN